VNLNDRRPSLKVSPDQFPYSDDPVKAALEYALRHQIEFDPSEPKKTVCPEFGSPECDWIGMEPL
jgi:hypothetical protein